MKKLLNFVLIVSFLLFTALTLTSCDAFGKSGGFIGKIISSKEESQSDDTRQSDNSSNGKESPQESVNDSADSSSEGESQSDNSSSEEESLQESANDSADSSSEEESQSEEIKEFFTLIYNYNNGEQNGEISVEKNASVKLQTPYRLGYTFTGWSINGNLKQSGEIITVLSDITAYATWEIDKYQIVYNLNGGALENAKSEFTINDLPLTLAYPDGETDDLSFVKWTTDEDGNDEISAISKDASSLKDYTLYAFYENSADCLTYKYNADLEGYEVFSYSGSAKSVTIPSTYRNISVKSIGNGAFSECRGLTSITIPDSVTSIGYSAFYICSGLTSVIIPDSVTSIGGSAFVGCSGLKSVTIPDSVTSIGNSAFLGCSGLTSITIPDSVTSIGDYAFYDCRGLTSVTIPDSVTNIRQFTFWDCSSLTSVTIPDSVTSIEYDAFWDCSSLTSITIGSGVTNLNKTTCQNCNELKTVFVKSEYVANLTDTDLYNYAETVYIEKSITVTNPLFSVVMEKESEEAVTVDGVEYYKYILKQ